MSNPFNRYCTMTLWHWRRSFLLSIFMWGHNFSISDCRVDYQVSDTVNKRDGSIYYIYSSIIDVNCTFPNWLLKYNIHEDCAFQSYRIPTFINQIILYFYDITDKKSIKWSRISRMKRFIADNKTISGIFIGADEEKTDFN